MAEDITITFKGVDEISSVIDDIKQKLDDLESGSSEESEDASATSLTIQSDEVEPTVEQVMWDLIDKIKTRATEDEAEFLLNA